MARLIHELANRRYGGMLESGSSASSICWPIGVFPLVDAVRVDILQHAYAVARASGDLAGCSSGVQPQRQGGMPQVVMRSLLPLNADRASNSVNMSKPQPRGGPEDPDSALRGRLL